MLGAKPGHPVRLVGQEGYSTPSITLLALMTTVAGEPTDDEEADILAATTWWSAILESMIREYPEQWFWMHRRWKTQPGDDPSVPAAIQKRD